MTSAVPKTLVRSLLASLALAAFTLAACSGTVEAPDDFSACSAADGDTGLDVSEVSVNADTLEVTVGHGGGCETQQYAICWPSQSFQGTGPRQTSFEIWFDDGNDGCEAYLSKVLSFPLGPVLDSYSEEFGAAGTLEMSVAGMDASYEF